MSHGKKLLYHHCKCDVERVSAIIDKAEKTSDLKYVKEAQKMLKEQLENHIQSERNRTRELIALMHHLYANPQRNEPQLQHVPWKTSVPNTNQQGKRKKRK